MKVWIASFGVLFVLAELYQWIEKFTLPLPVYILGGVLIAIASNYEKGILSYLGQELTKIDQDSAPTLPISKPIKPAVWAKINPSAFPSSLSHWQERSISFTIHRTKSSADS